MSGKGEGTRWSVERALKERPPILHPLGGCDIDTFLVHLSQNSGFDRRSLPQRIVAVLAVLARHPFSCIEKMKRGERVMRHAESRKTRFSLWATGGAGRRTCTIY